MRGREGKAPDLPDMEAVYDTIASAWTATRSGPWPEVLAFLAGRRRPAWVLDLGVGGGRYLAVEEAKGLFVVGLDRSRGQLKEAREVAGRPGRLLRGDARALPLRTGTFDAVLCVAVVHHLFEREDRVRVMREARRALRPGGTALFSGWGTHAGAFEGARRVDGGGRQDFLVPFKGQMPAPVWRYFHAYAEGELGEEAREAGFDRVRERVGRENRFAEAS